jgi:hypothetical protein
MSAVPDTPRPPPQSWLDALERGRADIAAGRTHEIEAVLAWLDAQIAEMEAQQQDEAAAPELRSFPMRHRNRLPRSPGITVP